MTPAHVSPGRDTLVTMLHCQQAAMQLWACPPTKSCPASHAVPLQLLSPADGSVWLPFKHALSYH